jgi:hypothetical protein
MRRRRCRRRARLGLPAALAPALLAVACAGGSEAEFDRRAGTYIGRTEADLIAGLGVPSRAYETPDGRRFVQYDTVSAQPSGPVVVPSIGLGFGNFGWGGGWGVGTGLAFGGYAPTPAVTCSLTFELRGGRVQGFDRRGGGCLA